MGYTHYWRIYKIATPDQSLAIITAAKKVFSMCEHEGVVLVNDDFGGPPKAETDVIRFNGVGKNEHETFLINLIKETKFDFCKTAHKPYDVAVTAILSICKDVLGNAINVSSDGDANDWQKGMAMACVALGRVVEVPLEQEKQ